MIFDFNIFNNTLILGCKIKHLREKFNTYIHTPANDEEPVFVIKGIRKNVFQVKEEIIQAANHFTKIKNDRMEKIDRIIKCDSNFFFLSLYKLSTHNSCNRKFLCRFQMSETVHAGQVHRPGGRPEWLVCEEASDEVQHLHRDAQIRTVQLFLPLRCEGQPRTGEESNL